MLQGLANGLALGGVYAMVAVGFSVIFSTTRTFHFAHGSVYLWAAYAIAECISWGWNPWEAIALGVAVAVVLGCAIELLVYQTMRRHGATGFGIFVASLGLTYVLQDLVILIFGPNVRPVTVASLSGSIHLGSTVLLTTNVLQVVFAIASLVGAVSLLRWTQTGRLMRAVASNPHMAPLAGVNVRRIYLLAFALGSALVVPAAFLNSVSAGLDPNSATTITLLAVIAVIVGGVGSVPGAALGGLMIGVAQGLSLLALSVQWQDVIAYGLLLVFIVARPQGILGQRLWQSGI